MDKGQHKQVEGVFSSQPWASLLALTAAVLWGWAYPLIKLGFGEFGITADMTSSKLLFAGIRFAVSGLAVLCVAGATGRRLRAERAADWWYILVFSLMNTTLHYAAFYIGLSHSQGARAAILNSLSVFTVVILACMFFKSDRLTPRKIAGCAVGFAGIMALNIGGGESGALTFLGDGMITLNALCGAVAGLMTRGLAKRVDIVVGTGMSLLLGGVLLVIPGLACGGSLPHVSLWGMAILLMLIVISTVGFSLYNKLLTCNPVGRVAIYNSLIPVVGAVTSCLCLQETFYMKYVVAGMLAAAGIYIINKGKR
ncbi:MAG: DMT family transporter [Prevotella sp.]